MNEVITFVAQEAEGGYQRLPLEHGNSPLLPMPYDMVWSIVCTIVILVLFWKFVLPKFIEVLEQRETTISRAIANAEAAEKESQNALEKYNEQLASARTEAQQIRDEARVRGKQIIEDAKVTATEEQNRIIAQGEQQLLAERERVVSELRKEMGQHSISLAEQLLGKQLSDDVSRGDTIDRFLADLDHVTPAGK